MEEVSALFTQLVNATTEEEVKGSEESIDAYGMSLEFVTATFQLISSTQDLNLQKQASYYLCVRFQHSFDDIPQESKDYVAQNFFELFFSLNFELYDYYEKFAAVLFNKIYILDISSSGVLEMILGFFEDESKQRGASLLINQLSQAATHFTSQEQSLSFVILQNSVQTLLPALQSIPDLYVKKNICNSLISLLHCTSDQTLQYAELIPQIYQVVEELIPILENTSLEFFVPFVVSYINIFSKLCSFIESTENFPNIINIANAITTLCISLKNNEITIPFFSLLSNGHKVLADYINEQLQSIIEELLLPLFVISEEEVAMSVDDPIEFTRNCIYSPELSDVRSAAAFCLSTMDNYYPNFPALIAQYFQQSLEQFSQDQNTLNLYAFLHFVSCSINKLLDATKIAQQEASTMQIIELLSSVAELLGCDELLQRCSFLLLAEKIDQPVLPVEVTIGIIEQMGEESPLLKYLASLAAIPQLSIIIHSQELLQQFTTLFSIDVSDLLNTVLTISHDFGDPDILKLITICVNIPAFQSSLIEVAPELITQTFELAAAFVEEYDPTDSRSLENEGGIFNGLINLVNQVKSSPQVLSSITEKCTEEIGSHLEFLDTPLMSSFIELINIIVDNDSSCHEQYFEIAKELFERINANQGPDTIDSICILIHNIFLSTRAIASQNAEWILSAVSHINEFNQSLVEEGKSSLHSVSLILSAAIFCIPEEATDERQSLFQLAIQTANEISPDPTEALYEIEDSEEVLYALFTVFPQEALQSLEDPMSLIDNISTFAAFPITTIEIAIAIYPYLEESDRDSIMSSILQFQAPSEIFNRVNDAEYDIDYLTVRNKPKNPLSDEERKAKLLTFFRTVLQSDPQAAKRQFIDKFVFAADHPDQEAQIYGNRSQEMVGDEEEGGGEF